MSDLTQLYQEIILDHNKRPRNYGNLEACTNEDSGNNPLCGDELTVYSIINDDVIVDIKFEAQGCAISRASASLMVQVLKGKTQEEAHEIFRKLQGQLKPGDDHEKFPEELGELIALSGVRKYPARVNCATLAWHTFLQI